MFHPLLTGMDADPELELLVRQVADLERPDGVEKSERHATDFARVVVSVAHRKPRHHHVRIADCLNLESERENMPTLNSKA